MSDYNKTPSFYNTEESFAKYLGNTSYYLGLQRHVLKIMECIKSKNVLELGSGTGHTAMALVNGLSLNKYVAVDNRQEMTDILSNNIALLEEKSF